tara:strand:- start:152 stop:511 length:360 start_codon:yes stop_codon:yes gene_type:complete
MLVWYFIRKNYKSLFKGAIPIALIYYVLNPLYWMWDPKISETGYGFHFLILFTLIYVFIFFWSLYHFRFIFSDKNNAEIKTAKASVIKNSDRLDKLMDIKAHPSLQTKSEEILKKNNDS